MCKRKELPVSLDIEFTESMGICVPLCIMSAEPRCRNWINTHYMMPIACMKGDDMFEYIIADGARYGWLSQTPYALLKFTSVGKNILKNVRDIVGLLIDCIGKNRYCVLFLDNFYLPCEENYKRGHYVHEVLVYGFDISAGFFQIITYGRKIHKAKIAFEDLRKGYEAAHIYIKNRDGWDDYMLMQYSLINHTEDYPYSKKQFLEKLQLYKSEVLPELVYFERYLYQYYGKEDCFYGLKTNEVMVLKMKRVREIFIEDKSEMRYDVFRQYGPIHTYAEFHKALLNRLNYYKSCFLEGGETEVIKLYQQIVEMCELARYLFLKIQVLLEEKDDKKILGTLNSIIDKFEFIAYHEPDIVKLILDVFTV